MLTDLETRLDALVLRAGFARTTAQARQFVVHRHILVDGNIVDRPSYRVKPGQTIPVKARARPWFRSRPLPKACTRCAAGGSGLPGRQPAFSEGHPDSQA